MADWTVEVTVKPGAMTTDDYRALLHSDKVVGRITDLADQIVQASGSPDDFEVLVQNQPETRRPRAFAKPRTGKGIRLELRDSVLIKGAASMGGS